MGVLTLYGSRMSPFVRKTLIVVAELGLGDRVTFTPADGSPLDAPGERARNPLKKIPFLTEADGAAVYDSRVVVERLLMEAPDQTLLAASGPARIETLTRQALADGLCDCAVTVAYERRLRPAEKQWSEWIELQWAKVASALDAAEAAAPPEGRFDLGDCALAGALPYLDARFEDRPWRDGRPQLAAWFERAKARPSVAGVLVA